MSREIKFRALERDDLTGRITAHYYSIGGKPQLLGDNRSWIAEDLQFTGLKDKNGVEIYEGDVLSGPRHYSGYDKYQISWDDEAAGFTLVAIDANEDTQDLWGWNGVIDKQYEVIGNIYENKELLP